MKNFEDNLVPYALALLLVFVGAWHMSDMASLSLDTVRIGYVPYSLRLYLPFIVPVIELCLGIMICFPALRRVGMVLNCGQFILYIWYHAWNLTYGIIESCHCLGVTSFFALTPKASAIFMICFNLGVIILSFIWLFESKNPKPTSQGLRKERYEKKSLRVYTR